MANPVRDKPPMRAPKTTMERLLSNACWAIDDEEVSDYSKDSLWESSLFRINNDRLLSALVLTQILLIAVTFFLAAVDPHYILFLLAVPIALTFNGFDCADGLGAPV